MNVPPREATRVTPDALQSFVTACFQQAGVPPEKANFLAGILVRNDLRGVFSHGTQQLANYVPLFLDGKSNPDPHVQVLNDMPTTCIVDGDGGLGYFPAWEASQQAVKKAREQGVAVTLTRNHNHIGAAGIYSRIVAEHDLIGYVTSGHQLGLDPSQNHLYAAGGSPMSWAIPAGEEPNFALDFGAVHDMYPSSPHVMEIFRLAPGTVFRCIGMGEVCQSLGGFLAGVPIDPARAQRQWEAANQGALIIAFDVNRFMPLEQFKREMDEYIRKVRELQPLPGQDRCEVAGGMEALREQEYSRDGIPIGDSHRQRLQSVGDRLGVAATF